jgi:hypothetical protein
MVSGVKIRISIEILFSNPNIEPANINCNIYINNKESTFADQYTIATRTECQKYPFTACWNFDPNNHFIIKVINISPPPCEFSYLPL